MTGRLKSLSILSLTALLVVALLSSLWADPAYAARKKQQQYSPKYSAIVVDAKTGRVLDETDSQAKRHPASLTKMMTLYMTFRELGAGRMQSGQRLRVSTFAAAQSPSKLGLRAGSSITVHDAMLGLITESANDAAVVLAEAIGGSEANFARMMTEQSRHLGMTKTMFRNASGLPDPQQITTARDMAILARALIYHYPDYYPLFSTTSFNYGGDIHNNHNRLMQRYDGMDGIKTGFIRASGFNLVASVQRNETRLVAVVFGGKSAAGRDAQMAALLDRNFSRLGLDRDYTTRVARNTATTSGNYLLPPRKPGMAPTETSTDENFSEGDVTESNQAYAYEAEDNSTDTPEFTAPNPTPMVVASVAPGAGVLAAPSTVTAHDQAALNRLIEEKEQTADPAAMATLPSIKPSAPEDASKWSVQVGAFNDKPAGERAIITAARSAIIVAPDVRYQLLQANNAQGAVYRAQLTGLDKDTAAALCGHLVRHGQSCMPVAPQR